VLPLWKVVAKYVTSSMQDMPFAANDFCADDTPLWDEMGGDENTDIL
jgi:hypothetical protein